MSSSEFTIDDGRLTIYERRATNHERRVTSKYLPAYKAVTSDESGPAGPQDRAALQLTDMKSEMFSYFRLRTAYRLPAGKHAVILTQFQTIVNKKTTIKANPGKAKSQDFPYRLALGSAGGSPLVGVTFIPAMFPVSRSGTG